MPLSRGCVIRPGAVLSMRIQDWPQDIQWLMKWGISSLGMFHDGGKDMCPHATGTIMSPKLTTGGKGGIFKWSSCSRDYLIKFLHTQQAKCLWKSSLQVSRLRFPQKLPGEIYDADQQCAWLFGKGSKHCMYNVGKNLCQHLWCQSEGHLCQTKYLPAADGTSCGAGKWCVQGQCVLNGRGVEKDSLEAVNGGWSDWGVWSECSRTCGGGVRQRDRRCDNPRPLYGGEPCNGISRSYRLCNTQDCDTSKEDFRTLQCRRYDRRPFHGSYYKWRPYTKINQVSDQCKLYCQALGYDFITALSNQVQDGTPCNQYSPDVCVEGSCKSYGCDMIIDSDAKEDSCGVCRGDNSTCRVVKGEFRSQPRLRTYFPITVIPKHSRHIHIKEETYSHNYVAIRDIYGNYYLNGNMNMDPPGVYTLGGVRFEYRRTQNMQESLVAKGPLKQDIVLEVLVMGRNPGILYDYTLPTRRTPLPDDGSTNHYPPHNDYQPPPSVHHPNQYDHPAPRKTTPRPTPRPTPPRHYYSWRTIKFNCSETCGGGEQTQRAQCWLDQRYHVNPGLCDPKRRPFEGSVACNTQPCEPRWVTYEWRTCSRTCGGGKQVRKVRCRQKLSSKVDRRVDKRMCSRQPRPTRRRWCNTQDCPGVWVVGEWSECSVSCGSGVHSRELSCQSLTSYGFKSLSDSACNHLPRHVSEKPCRLAECQKDPYQWVVSSWSKCSASCGMGVKTRALRCSFNGKTDTALRSVDSHYCTHISKPSHVPLQEVCTNQACSPGDWYISAWSKCSATCGNGVQTRLVYCRDMRNHRRTTGCDWLGKPIESQHCNSGHCPVAAPYRCVDQFSWCDLVPKHNVCRHNFYGTRCCHSCRNQRS
ncbi:A disintegrin and metalloproteinase with thrombospondin motifs 18-like [Liolophura sinensis]|uniref:A disintegrin and metalloproteinase with thrombospondin motifs 18-like n=1 Tax=Liolophura sinensis TaxID=3198878 RepID=UPI003158DA15